VGVCAEASPEQRSASRHAAARVLILIDLPPQPSLNLLLLRELSERYDTKLGVVGNDLAGCRIVAQDNL
jgi:hypothetical protein